MIYVFENPNNGASVVYDGSTLTQEEQELAVVLQELPAQTGTGVPILKCNKQEQRVWWDYLPASTDLETLTNQVTLMQQALDELLLGGM